MAVEIPKPQPVPNSSGHFSQTYGPGSLEHVNGASSAVGMTIANYAASENNLRITMLGCFGRDIAITEALISELKRDGQMGVLVRSALSLRGRDDLTGAATSFFRARNVVKRFRDAFAHGVWSRRSDLAGVILFGGDSHRRAHAKLFEQMRADPFSVGNFSDDHGEVWLETDFAKAVQASEGLLQGCHALSACLSQDPQEAAWLRDELVSKGGLLADPPHVLSQKRTL